MTMTAGGAPVAVPTVLATSLGELVAGVPTGRRPPTASSRAAWGPGRSCGTSEAVGRNPLYIIIPCHRVVGATSRAAGYAGGLDRKRALLEIEHAGALRAGLARREREQLMSIEENKAAVGRW
jgi:O-6-methylguanine DNA methyltransferase